MYRKNLVCGARCRRLPSRHRRSRGLPLGTGACGKAGATIPGAFGGRGPGGCGVVRVASRAILRIFPVHFLHGLSCPSLQNLPRPPAREPAGGSPPPPNTLLASPRAPIRAGERADSPGGCRDPGVWIKHECTGKLQISHPRLPTRVTSRPPGPRPHGLRGIVAPSVSHDSSPRSSPSDRRLRGRSCRSGARIP